MISMAAVASYRAGEAAELLGVSVDTVRRLGDAGKLRYRTTAGGQRLIDGKSLAAFMEAQAQATEPEVVVARSARNRMPGIVIRVLKDKVTAQVEIQAGPHRIVSLMTREAAEELGLAPGVRAVAAVKSTNVVVELPQRR